MRIQTSALPEYCAWCGLLIDPHGTRYWGINGNVPTGPYCCQTHLNLAFNSGSGANRSETSDDRANGVAQVDESAVSASLHRAQHDGDERGKNPSEVGQENA